MRTILCVIDLGVSSMNVLKVAARMANARQANLAILFPYRLIDYSFKGDLAKLKSKIELEARDKFELIKKQISAMDKLSYEFQIEIGFPADRISTYVTRNKLDMIIIGQNQADTISEINGIALQKLITNSKLPFTIVPEEIDAEILST